MHGERSILRALSAVGSRKAAEPFRLRCSAFKIRNVRQPMRFTAVGGGAQVARSTKTGGISSGCPLFSS